MRNAIIIGSGMAVPERVVPNSFFDQLLGEDVSSWLESNVEISERRWCSKDQSVSDLCIEAALKALEDAKVSAEEIDLLVIATDTPEYVSPSTASKVQYLLGLKNAGSFDLNSACAGFVTALDLGSKYIKADENYKYVLVIGAYAMSKYLNLKDKKTVTLFADGAGAVVLKSSQESGRGQLASTLITRGEYYDYMGIYGGATKNPCSSAMFEAEEHKLRFVKKFPKELNPNMWSSMARDLCKSAGVSISDVDHFFLTQININSIRETLDILGVNHDKATTVMHHYGYTGSACIPMAFDTARKSGKVHKGQLAVFIGSGGGLAFAGALFKI